MSKFDDFLAQETDAEDWERRQAQNRERQKLIWISLALAALGAVFGLGVWFVFIKKGEPGPECKRLILERDAMCYRDSSMPGCSSGYVDLIAYEGTSFEHERKCHEELVSMQEFEKQMQKIEDFGKDFRKKYR